MCTATDQRCRAATCLSVEFVGTDEACVYDLEVEDTHCYFAEGVLVSNCHMMKAQSSDQGQAFGTLVGASKRTLALTGTMFGGLSTTLFYLLHRLDAGIRREFGWREGQRFASLYGVLERIVKNEEQGDEEVDVGVFSGVRREFTRVKELPGVSPALAARLLERVVFLTLADLGYELPPYTEEPVVLRMAKDQRKRYAEVEGALLAAAKDDFSLMSEYLQSTLAYPDECWRDIRTSVGAWKALPSDALYPKEEWLRNLCVSEAAQNRRVLIYVHYTSTRDIQPRLHKFLRDAGLRVAILQGVAPERRAEWMRRKAREGVQVVITNPRLVQTGLNLVMFSTVAYYQIDYSLYLVQQALRRLVRPGQEHAVRSLITVYADSMEHRAVYRVKEKLRAAKMLYGDDLVGALVNMGGSSASVLEQLVRDVMANTAVPDLTSLFAQAEQDARSNNGWLLGPDAAAESTAAARVVRELERAHLLQPAEGVQSSLFDGPRTVRARREPGLTPLEPDAKAQQRTLL